MIKSNKPHIVDFCFLFYLLYAFVSHYYFLSWNHYFTELVHLLTAACRELHSC